MRISDWSSDVCSSDLFIRGSVRVGVRARPVRNVAPYRSECKVVRIGLRALMVRASLYEGEGRAGPPTEPRMAPPPARLSPALPVALRQGEFHRVTCLRC